MPSDSTTFSSRNLREMRRFLSFAMVGVLGFVVDASVLYLGLHLGAGLRLGRVISYLVAVTTTWGLNRLYTFKVPSGRTLWTEWARFTVSQLGGAAANLGMYYLLIRTSRTVALYPVLGVAAGSLSGLAINYLVARVFVFGGGIRYKIPGKPRPGTNAIRNTPGAAAPPPARHRFGWRNAVQIALLLGGLIWPALFNGQPFFFPDTTTYIRGADAGIQAAFKRKSAWSLPQAESRSSLSSVEDKTVLTGRSPYYGALLYVGDRSGGFWLSIVIQGAALLSAIGLTLRASGLAIWPDTLLIPACLAAVTTAPFFVSLLMPDVFAGIAILSAAYLFAVNRPLPARDACVALVLLTAACIFHDSHVLIVAAMLALALGRALWLRSWANRTGLALVILALMISALAQSVFFMAVRHVSGAPPLRPPFLMARTIEDGPGYRYLHDTCPGSGFVVCRFVDRLPMPADEFLWKSGPEGVFVAATPAERRALTDEQMRFVAAVAAHDPWGQLRASAADAARQLVFMNLRDFQYTAEEKAGLDAKVPSPHLETLRASAAYNGTLPIRFLNVLLQTTVLISAFTVGCLVLRRRPRAALPAPTLRIAMWTVIGFLINAAVCGILSGPHERYAARVAWLLPFAALLLIRARSAGSISEARPDATAQIGRARSSAA